MKASFDKDKYVKQSIAILLIIFALLNLTFLAMGDISINTFWLSLAFLFGVSWIFYREKISCD